MFATAPLFRCGSRDTPMITSPWGAASELVGPHRRSLLRIPVTLLHDWATRLGLRDLTENRMQRCFERSNTRSTWRRCPSMRSRSTSSSASAPTDRVFREAARRNTDGCTGLRPLQLRLPAWAKLSVDVTYLPPRSPGGAYLRRMHGHANPAAGRSAQSAWSVALRNGPNHLRRAASRRARRVVVAAGATVRRSSCAQRTRAALGQVGKNCTLHPASE